jgi:hypothetical protein
MIQVKNIKMERAEGLTTECITVETNTYKQANITLRQWALTAPKNGGYNKCDVVVSFENNEKISFRFDMEFQHSTQANILQKEIISLMNWYAGKTENPHCGKEVYNNLIETYKKSGNFQQAQTILENYDLIYSI